MKRRYSRGSKPGVAAPFTFPKAPTLPKARFEHPPVVVGAGPAGLFAALTLARAGVQPILIERGKPVEERTKSVQMMQEQGILDPESNVQFGEGGAGAFSDGKLTTGTKSPLIRTVLQTFVDHGAPEDILYDRKTARRHGFAQGRCALDAAGNHPTGRSSAV